MIPCTNITLHEDGCGHDPLGKEACYRLIWKDDCIAYICKDCLFNFINSTTDYASIIIIDLVDKDGIPLDGEPSTLSPAERLGKLLQSFRRGK